MRKCPKCGSKQIAPILYGMPAMNEEMQQRINEKKIYLGGCMISDRNPTYHCFKCRKNVGTRPVLINKQGKENYPDIVTSIRFYDGGYFDGYPQIMIQKEEKISLEVTPGHLQPMAYLQREMAKEEWDKLLDRLYNKLYLHEWKKIFYNPEVQDGEQWELEITLTGKRVRNYSGSNAFPPYWAELKTTFRPYFKEAGIKY